MGKGIKSNPVYGISLVLSLILVAWGIFLPGNFANVANLLFSVVTGQFGWTYTIAVSAFVFFCIWIAVSKYGKIKLGKDEDKPEYSTLVWFAMLFSAGMGIGLIFWGVAEPLNFFVNPLDVVGGSPEAAEFAIRKAFLHWSFHPWACFGVVGLGLAYMQFRKGKPSLISSIFIPLLGEKRVNGWLGKLIDILATIATVCGVCTSLGLGTMQINSGLNFVFGVPENSMVQIIIIVVITIIFTATAVIGIEKGISYVANTNMVLAFVLMLIGLIVGPTSLILATLSDGVGGYLQNFLQDCFTVGAYKNGSWYGSWTIFYWAWWVAWASFCGSFIARISKGRTIKEFIAGVLLVPALLSFVWFAIFGSMGISQGLDLAKEAIVSTSTACFMVFSQYPLGMVMCIVTILLVCTFFITSANSATFVLGMLTSHGSLNPPGRTKLVWGIVEAALTIALLLSSDNGLQMLQNISIAGAFPFLIVMIFIMWAIAKAMKQEVAALPKGEKKKAVTPPELPAQVE